MSKSGQNDEISAYLANPADFDQGLALYVRYGKNDTLKAIFSRSGATAYNHQKLLEALLELSTADGVTVRSTGSPVHRIAGPSRRGTADRRSTGSPVHPGGEPRGRGAVDAAPWTASTTVNREYAVPANHPELVKRYRQRAMWKSQLTLLPTQEERRDQAFAILDLTDEIEQILYHGFKKAVQSENLPDDRATLAKRLATNGKYISKFRDRDDKQAEINRRRAENEEIEGILAQQSPS